MNINTLFPTFLTRHLLLQLQQAAPSLILNLSSGAAVANPPFFVSYADSKPYNLAFSHTLCNEMKYLKTNVHVLAVLVGNVNSAANKKPVSLFCPSSMDYKSNLLTLCLTGLSIQFLIRMTAQRSTENTKDK